MLSENALKQLDEIRARYPNARSGLLPALHVAQEDQGCVCPDVLQEVARYFNLPPGEVESVASFYTMYRERRLGKYLLQVCTSISCGLLGAGHIVDYISEKLGIKVGETTSDGKFTLLTTECLGTCGTAPVMQINDTFHENLTPEKIDELLASLG